jgi:protein-disulfide isomerase
MKKKLVLGMALLGALAFNAQAESIDFSKLTAQDKEEIGKIVKDYMVAHPELLIEMSDGLKAKQQEAQAKQLEENTKIAIAMHEQILNDKDTPFIGPENAKIAVVEFFDYNCVYCSRVAPELKVIMKNNPDIKFVFKEMPIFENRFPSSKLAAQVANKVFKEKGNDAYLKFHDAIYETKHFEGELTTADIQKAAKLVGVDPKVKADDFTDKIETNMKLSEKLGIHGTPSFIFMPTANQNPDNTLIMMQAASKEELQSIIDQLRAKIGDGEVIAETPVKK